MEGEGEGERGRGRGRWNHKRNESGNLDNTKETLSGLMTGIWTHHQVCVLFASQWPSVQN